MDGESESSPNYLIIVLPALNQYYGIDIQNTQILHVEIAITKYYHETDIFCKNFMVLPTRITEPNWMNSQSYAAPGMRKMSVRKS